MGVRRGSGAAAEAGDVVGIGAGAARECRGSSDQKIGARGHRFHGCFGIDAAINLKVNIAARGVDPCGT